MVFPSIIPSEKHPAVQLKTILNFVEPYKSFVYKKARWADSETKTEIEILIEPRANGRGICSGCGKAAPGYDHLPTRRFEFVPLWQIAVYFMYAMRRVDCPTCGVKVVQVPWCDGKNQLTTTYRWFWAGWAKRLSWKGVADAFCTTWQNVFRSVKHAVSWGLEHRSLKGIEAIGVDEVQWQCGHKYLTLVYQIDDGSKRLLWIGKNRTTKTFLRFFRMLGKERSGKLKFVCSDMWKPYLKVIAKKASGAIHVLDRFHLMQKMNKAIDEVRAGEARQLKEDGYEPVLKHSRWCLLKRPAKPDRQTDGETFRVASIQPAVGAGSLVARRFPTVLGVREPCMGREVPRPVVSTNDAEQARTDEESGSYLTQPPGVDSQLVSRQRGSFLRNRRGIQQQSKTDHEKIVRLSYL